jgi:hypothetical protein
VLYLQGMAPGLTWANNGSDGGDLIAAAATGGIAHPTGYPLYLLLARLFQYLPFGSLAFRTNLMSAIFSSLASLLIYKIVLRAQSSVETEPAWLGGIIAGLAFGVAPLIWSQAVITEVYTFQAFLTALILFLYVQPAQPARQKYWDCWRGLLLGLSMGNHLTTILIVPAALLMGSFHSQMDGQDISAWRDRFKNLKFSGASLGRQFMGFSAGAAIYLLLPLRALMHPSISWGSPTTPQRFWWLVSGQLYQSYYLQPTLPEIWIRIQASIALLLDQFGFVGITIGMIGLILYGSWSRHYILTVWIAVISSLFAVLYDSTDSYLYLLPMFLCFAIWIGTGLSGLEQQLVQGNLKRLWLVGLLLLVYFCGRVVSHWNQVDASQDLRAETFGREILLTAPKDAIIFAEGDDEVFTLWYFHFALKERPDLIVIAEDLLHFDWYQETLQKTYPALFVPGPFPWPETMAWANPLHVICYVRHSSPTDLECSEPLSPP